MPHYTEPRQFVIHSVTIENYRGIKHAHLVLGKVNVLVGVNGSGKSSILQAIAFYFESLIAPMNSVWLGQSTPSIDDFHFDETRIKISLKFSELGVDDIANSAILKFLIAPLTEAEQGSELIPPYSEGEILISNPKTAYAAARLNDISNDPSVCLDMFAYYPVRRSVETAPLESERTVKVPRPRLLGFSGAYNGKTNFESFFRWFRNQEDIENEMRLTESPDFRNSQLEAVRSAIEKALDGYTNLRVQRSPRLAMVMLKEGDQTSFEQMSDGEKAVITLVGDIARRACILNPHLEDPLKSPGVVMVDEIEQHLHPQWQRRIVEKLPEVFPNIQFIFTSHSPIVCNSVGPDELLVIRDGEIKPATAYGWSTKDVLKEIFEIDERPDDVNDKLKQLDDAIDNANLVLAKELVSELSKNLPLQDPELMRAKVIIPMLEMESMDERS